MGRSARKRKALPADPVEAYVDSMAHDGRGVARVEGKAVFVDGALPGERVRFRYRARRRQFDEGETVEVLQASPARVEPHCIHFDVCGGCSLQHMDTAAQIEAKQGVLLDNLRRIGGVEPEEVLAPLTGPHWGYRRRARLGVKHVHKKGRVLVGFRERHSSFVAELSRCEVLHPQVGERLSELAELIASLEAYNRIPQIEVAVADNAAALVFRNLDPLSEADRDRLVAFARRHGLHVYLQPGGPDTVHALWPDDSRLALVHAEQDIELRFEPTDFVQVNFDMNRSMVARVLELLAPGNEDRILDLFCGLGNFTLPLARAAGEVVGVEGEAGLVQRARDNAAANGIDNAAFHTADLSALDGAEPWLRNRYDKLLFDPPRSGAEGVIPHIQKIAPQRIVYVSCHPGSLARDAGTLVNEHGYRLRQAGVMDMFPHTAHVESIAVFDRY